MSQDLVTPAIQFMSLLSAGLLAGSLYGVSLYLNPAGLDAATYTQQQQQGVRTLNTPMPLLGAITLFLSIAVALLVHNDRVSLLLCVAAGACFLAAGLVTRFFNQPINSIVMTWSASAVPADWMDYRSRWWRWHVLRTFSGILGLAFLICALLLHR